jgi:hypothetical protein
MNIFIYETREKLPTYFFIQIISFILPFSISQSMKEETCQTFKTLKSINGKKDSLEI